MSRLRVHDHEDGEEMTLDELRAHLIESHGSVLADFDDKSLGDLVDEHEEDHGA